MHKTFTEYQTYVWQLNRRKHDVDKHHILPISSYWPNIPENIADVLMADHKKIHQTLDVAYRYFSTIIRKQRSRENWHIVLTVDDIEGRADIQRAYLDWVHKLPNFLQQMHEIKLGELVIIENEKLSRLVHDKLSIELGSTLTNHSIYVEIQKELSKAIYKRLKSR